MPSAAWAVMEIRSSCSRPLLWAVCAETLTYGDWMHPRGQVDVVGGEVLDDPHVGDAVGERALAAGGDLVDLAEFALLESCTQCEQRGVAALDVADGVHQTSALEGLDQLARHSSPSVASGFSISVCTPAAASSRPASRW